MIFINPIAKYSYNKSLQPLPKAQASQIVSAKADSFELSNKAVNFKGKPFPHFPVEEVEEIFAKAYQAVRSENDISKKRVIFDEHMVRFREVSRRIRDQGALHKEHDNFCHDRAHELFSPLELLEKFGLKIEIQLASERPCGISPAQYDEHLKSTIDEVINIAKRYEFFLDNGLDKDIMPPINVFKMVLNSLNEAAKQKRITIEAQGEELLNDYLEGINVMQVIDKSKNPKPVRQNDYNLYIAFSNLIQNAIKYSPDGSRIKIRFAKQKIDGKNYLEFSVSDNGIGIPKGEQEKVFRRRASNAITSGIPGTGYGLGRTKQVFGQYPSIMKIESPYNEVGKEVSGTKISSFLRLEDD